MNSPRPSKILLELQSILEPIAIKDAFPRNQPTEVELGCGDGSFLIDYAKARPDKNFLAVERLQGRLDKVARKANRAGLSNVRAVRIESSYLLEFLLPRNSVSALHLYFPDPWPKRKHWRYRLVNERFPLLCAQALTPAGRVFLRTDHQEYFGVMQATFRTTPLFAEVSSPPELLAITTDFEKEFNKQGIVTLQACYERTQEPLPPVTKVG